MTEFEIKSRDLDDYDLTTPLSRFRSMLIRGSILFGVAIFAVTVIVPALKEQGDFTAMNGSNLDMMATGSISSGGQSTTYRVQRNILQPGSGPCVMWPDGRSQGAC